MKRAERKERMVNEKSPWWKTVQTNEFCHVIPENSNKNFATSKFHHQENMTKRKTLISARRIIFAWLEALDLWVCKQIIMGPFFIYIYIFHPLYQDFFLLVWMSESGCAYLN
jgi:hypothetical protein